MTTCASKTAKATFSHCYAIAPNTKIKTWIKNRETFEIWFKTVYRGNPNYAALRQSLAIYGSPNLVTNALRCLNKGKQLPVK